MNNTTHWWSAMAVILGAAIAVQLLADAGMIGNPTPLLALALGALGMWQVGYGALSFAKGIFDVLGPLLTFTRHQRPQLFLSLVMLQVLCGLILIVGAARTFLAN